MSRKNNRLWIVGASAAPLAHWAGGGWLTMALAVAAVIPLCWLPGAMESQGKPQSLLGWIWSTAVLGSLLPAAGAYWPGGEKAVEVILLTLAALAGNDDKRERAGNTLFWLLVPIVGSVLLLGFQNVEWTWLKPKPEQWTGELLCVLLLPALAASGGGKGSPGITPVYTALTALASAILIQGILSPDVAVSVSAPLYETGRALGPGGEILVSVGTSLSWYSFASLLFGNAKEYARKAGIRPSWAAAVTWGFGAGMVLLNLRVPGAVLAVGSLITWVILPFFGSRKNN